MNVDGWIPRELIVGDESALLVPPEFLVQYSTHANPPVLIGAALNLIKKLNVSAHWRRSVFDRMKSWYNFLKRTQSNGDGSYRWRGRKEKVDEYREALNPTTLPSGLDDYPRSSHLAAERHVDLFAWVAYAARVLSLFADDQEEKEYFEKEYRFHVEHLDNFHWTGGIYADFGLHSEDVKLDSQRIFDQKSNSERNSCKRVVGRQPTEQFVDGHFGYLSLFPIMLQIIDDNILEERLSASLDAIDRFELISDFGLRSLSPSSSLYQKRNTPDDPPYWRGAIWPHMNYMFLRALYLYSKKDLNSTLSDRILRTYKKVRENLLKNVDEQFQTSGYLYEQYDDRTGKGAFGKPFTGWTSLVALIAAEKYHEE